MTNKIKIEIDLDDKDLKKKVEAIADSVQHLGKNSEVTARSVHRLEKRSRSFGVGLRDLALTLGMARSALHNIHAVSTEWVYKIIQTNAQVERMTKLMEGLSSEIDATSRAMQAQNDVNWIFDLAKETPFSVQTLTDSFVKFRSVGLDPTDGSLRALSSAVAAFGGTSDQFHRASIAIQQMGGKGVVSMEELRQQLGEAVPSAVKLMARSMGLSFKELVDLISEGKVEANSALQKMLNEFEMTFAGANDRLMNTWSGMLARMQTLAVEAFTDQGQGTEFFAEAKKALQEIMLIMEGPGFRRMAKDIDGFLASLLRWSSRIVKELFKFREVAINAAQTLGTLFAVGLVSKWTFALGGAVMGLRGLYTSMMAAGKATAIATTAMRGLGMAMAGLAGPFGIAIALGYTLWQVLDGTKNKLDSLRKSVERGFVDAQQIDEAKSRLSELRQQQEQDAAALTELNRKNSVYNTAHEKKQIEIRMKLREKEMSERVSLLKKADDILEEEVTDREMARLRNQRGDALGIIGKQFDAQREDIAKRQKEMTELAAGGQLTPEQKKEFAAERLQAVKDYNERHIALLERFRDQYADGAADLEARQATLAAKERAKLQAHRNMIDEIGKQIADARETALHNLAIDAGENNLLKDSETQAAAERMQADWLRLTRAIAKYNAEIEGTSVTQADLEAKMDTTTLKGEDLKAEIMRLAAEKDRLAKAVKIVRQEMKNSDSAFDSITGKYNKLVTANNALSESYLSATAGLGKSGRNTIAAMKEQAKLIKNVYQAQDAWAKIKKTEQELYRQQTLNAASKLREQIQNAQQAVMTEEERIRATYAAEEKAMEDSINLAHVTAEERKKIEEELAQWRLAREKKLAKDLLEVSKDWKDGVLRASKKLQEEYEDHAGAMESAYTKAFSAMEDGIVSFVKTGKFEVSDFVDHMITEIIRMGVRQAVMQPLNGIMGQIFGGSGSSTDLEPFGGSGSSNFFNDMMKSIIAIFHDGGVVGKGSPGKKAVNPMIFANAPRFHGGGFPGLKSNEVPAVLEKGEGVFTRDQMRALGGMISRPAGMDVQFNLVNKSGNDVRGQQQGQPRFDGQQMILDVVLKAANQPGKFRDGMKGAMAG